MNAVVGSEYLFGKGKVSLAERDANGAVSKVLYLGNCPELKFSGSTEKVTHFDSQSGLNTQDRDIVKSVSMEMSVTLESISNDNLAILVWGQATTVASAPTQSHFFPEDIANGEYHMVPNGFNISVPVLKDSAGSPVTVPTTKWTIDPDFGVVHFLDVATYTQPFELEYTRGAYDNVPFFTTQRPQRFLRFEGLNLGNPGLSYSDKYVVELYNIGLDPVSDLSLIGEDFGKFELKGSVQVDESRVSNALLGGYGRIAKL